MRRGGPPGPRRSGRRAGQGLALAVLFAGRIAGQAHAQLQDGAPARFSDFVYQGRYPIYAKLSAAQDQYLNPVLEGFYPDPSITRRGDDFYLVNSSFTYFPGLPIFHSRDLVNWTQIGNAIDRPSQLKFDGLGISRGVFAPDLTYHDGLFYLLNTCVDCGGNYLLTAREPAGPWSDPVWLGFDGIDPSLFFDDDGRAYVVNNGPPAGPALYDGHRAIWIQQFDPEKRALFGPRSVIVDGGTDIAKHPSWIEGPHLFKREGRYYLIAAEGGTGDQHSEVVFRSDSVRGPYLPWSRNPILTQRGLAPRRADPITSAGHAEFIQTPAGDWWSVFLATRPYADDFYNTGRETFLLPVRWADGWPEIAPPGEGVAYRLHRPALAPQPEPTVPTQGDFMVRERFDGPSLPPYWETIRTPHRRWWSVSQGVLTIQPRPDALGGLGQPSFLGRRQQHMNASASVVLRYDPSAPGDEAGLAAFQDTAHYYAIALARNQGAVVVKVERRTGDGDSADGVLVASAAAPGAGDRPLGLRIQARGGRYDFAYALRPGVWRTLVQDADGTRLSTKADGGFTGVMLGLYARAPGHEPASPQASK